MAVAQTAARELVHPGPGGAAGIGGGRPRSAGASLGCITAHARLIQGGAGDRSPARAATAMGCGSRRRPARRSPAGSLERRLAPARRDRGVHQGADWVGCHLWLMGGRSTAGGLRCPCHRTRGGSGPTTPGRAAATPGAPAARSITVARSPATAPGRVARRGIDPPLDRIEVPPSTGQLPGVGAAPGMGWLPAGPASRAESTARRRAAIRSSAPSPAQAWPAR